MEQRRSPRVPIAVPCTLARDRGGPVQAHTLDLSAGGMRVEASRPLRIDEVLTFDLALDEGHVDGRARVLRQQGMTAYALRFERLDPDDAALLRGVVTQTA